MRNEFINELIIQARVNPNIFLIVGDLGYSVVDEFAAEFPDRFLNAGIAEQGMTGLAAGLASEGFHVFTYSIANFSTFRSAEQFRNDIAYHKFSVTAVAVGGGLAYGNLGYSHHAVQDLALMRSFPNVMMSAPGDKWETRACVQYLTKNPQPSYLRLGKSGERDIHQGTITVNAGELKLIRNIPKSNKLLGTILTTGASLSIGLSVVESVEANNSWELYSAPIWNYYNYAGIVKLIQECPFVVIIEDHLAAGGFCSFIREIIDNKFQHRIKGYSLDPKVCGLVADQLTLNKIGGLDASFIASELMYLK